MMKTPIISLRKLYTRGPEAREIVFDMGIFLLSNIVFASNGQVSLLPDYFYC